MRRFTFNILLLTFSILIGLIIIESITRIFVKIETPFALTPRDLTADIRMSVLDKRGFWTLKPGYKGVFDNKVDFRAKPVTVEDDGSRRIPCALESYNASKMIYLLGDSQTFGWGLSDEETWANHLQCGLNKKLPNSYQVRNFGFPGAQADQIFTRGIEQIAPATRPGDVVIVSLTWNDLINFYTGRASVRYAAAKAGLRVNEGTWKSITPVGTSEHREKVTNNQESLALQLIVPLRYLNPPSWRFNLYRKHGIFFPSFSSTAAFFNSMKHTSAVYGIALSSARIIYYRWRSEETLLRKFPKNTVENNFFVVKALATTIERQGARVIVQLLPPRQFFDDYYYRSYSNDGLTFPVQDYMGYVSEPWCERVGLICENLFSKLKTSSRDAHSFAYDGHYNATGARVIAKALIEKFYR